MPDDMSLGRLHDIIQVAMGWQDGHLHAFHIGGKQYGFPDSSDPNFKISSVIAKGFKSFKYEYDFGDGWEHEVLVEELPEFDPQLTYPRYVDGARRCPPEDVGGIGGYFDFLEAVLDPHHPEHEEMRDWYGGDFKPDELDVESIELGLAIIADRRRPGPRKKKTVAE